MPGGIGPLEFYQGTRFSSVDEPQKISLAMFNRVVEKITNDDVTQATKKAYHAVWRCFNRFLLAFDDLPTSWEDKMVLYASFLADVGSASSTVASYMSAIRYMLRHDGIEINNKSCRLSSIIRACKLRNDVVSVKRPLRAGMLKLILDKVNYRYQAKGQPYLAAMYKAIFTSAYFGLMRISELVGKHAVKAADVKVSTNRNKRKVKYLLRSSKTHHPGRKPQSVNLVPDAVGYAAHLCPVKIVTDFLRLRPPRHPGDHLFVFSDNSPVNESHVRAVLKRALLDLNLPAKAYSFHGWRSGRATDLYKRNFSVEFIRDVGRWSKKSTAIYRYFKD